ncbi:MAG TPA: hypothetical protein VJ020_05580 [Anaerolineales bacterium]|nr:hypothetical protein [Anaerolineales bacterium]
MTGSFNLSGILLMALWLGVAACSPAQAQSYISTTQSTVFLEPTATPTATTNTLTQAMTTSPSVVVQPTTPLVSAPAMTKVDAQGAVEFAVTPLNLTAPAETLDFDVSLNTHSVDLSWDLAAQATLAADTGLEVKGLSWPVGGGHHYEGILTFPAKTAEGKPLLDGAETLTLNIRDAGAPERVFVWSISP